MTDSSFLVQWTIDDEDSADPEAAAHSALRTLHDAFAGDAGAANVFTVIDRRSDQVHVVDLGDLEGPLNRVTTVWPRPEGQRFQARLNATDARAMIGENGFATLRVRIGKEEFLDGYAEFLSATGDQDHFDALHDLAYSFGMPYDASAEIVSVDGDDFLVDYTTDIATALREEA